MHCRQRWRNKHWKPVVRICCHPYPHGVQVENQPPDDGRQGNEDTGVVDEAGKTRQQPRSTQNQKIGNTRPQEALPDKGNINKAAAANPFAKIRADGDTGQKTGKSK